MEQFSRRLGDLSSRVESTHEHTAQGLELGARQRDEQLRGGQLRLFNEINNSYLTKHVPYIETGVHKLSLNIRMLSESMI